MDIIPFKSNVRMICLDFPLYTLFLTFACATILSQCIQIAVIGLGQNGIPRRKSRSHSALVAAKSKVINSATKVNTYPLVDLVSELTEIQCITVTL